MKANQDILPSLQLPAERLRWRCDPAVFEVANSGELESQKEVIGQERALKALQLGVEVRSPGYNVFVSGLSGTGRMTAVHRLLVGISDHCVDVPDKAFVHNFKDATCPRLVELPRGRVRRFQQGMEEFAKELPRGLRDLFESTDYIAQRRALEERAQQPQRKAFDALQEECRLSGLALVQVQSESVIQPGLAIPVEKEMVPFAALDSLVSQGKLDQERGELLRSKGEALQAKLDEAIVQARRGLRKLQRTLDKFDAHSAKATFKDALDDLRDEFGEAEIRGHLDAVEGAILDNLELFADDDEESAAARSMFLRRLRVNAVLDNAEREDTPVIAESNPTFTNLFGTVEHRVNRSGDVWTDHTRIRGGSLLQADGGYLILNADDVLIEPGVWQTLKRVLKLGRIQIQPKASAFGVSPLLFKPEPIPLSVKVILIGDSHTYGMLHSMDPDFRKTFKIRADFDSVMDRTPENIRRYGHFLRRLGDEENLAAFDAGAMARIAEQGARRTEQDGKLSTRFSEIADLARESQHYAQKEGATVVSASHVEQALDNAVERDNLYDSKLEERILDGTVRIDTENAVIGQVNALTVFQSGKFSFGKPSRITSTIAAGDHGILNVEREVQLSGEIHDKGVLILASFLRERYGQRHPLSLSASLCFEQNYVGVDGDSASSTELYALLSSIAQVPLRQSIAVTGSVDQKGFIQPIGGANEKIEGYFDICAARGLDGSHGVILPVQNIGDLMLAPRVVEAVAAKKFFVWAIRHVDEGIEVLTGIPVGTPGKDGNHPEGSLGAQVSARLLELAELARDFKGSGSDEKGADGGSDSESGGDVSLEEETDTPAESTDD